ncbi:MAG: hypothetical protein EBU46_13515 [Nitrosomonadaceae bacterium]|nr:hypothetical protein [Nitrosomonadaceae bacterium]
MYDSNAIALDIIETLRARAFVEKITTLVIIFLSFVNCESEKNYSFFGKENSAFYQSKPQFPL